MSCQLLVNAQTEHVTQSTGLINELIGIQVAAANLLLSALLLLFGQSKAINKRRKSRGPTSGLLALSLVVLDLKIRLQAKPSIRSARVKR